MSGWMPVEAQHVLGVDDDAKLVIVNTQTVQGEEFRRRVEKNLINRNTDNVAAMDGISCKLLKPGGMWQNVKVRAVVTVTLEYMPE